jgi:DNA modification methylase
MAGEEFDEDENAPEKSSDKVELFSEDGESRGFYDLKNRVNDCTGKEWIFSTKSVIPKSYPPSFQHALRNRHGGQKPPELCAEIIKAFTKKNDLVLDPFAGVGGTLLGCAIAKRRGFGIEITKDWIDLYHEICRLEHIIPFPMINGDSVAVVPVIRQQVDFVLTDIPYWTMDKVEKSKGTFKRTNEAAQGVYSDRSKLGRFDDGATSSKESWLDLLKSVFSACYAVLKNKGYVAVFVGNMYNKGEFHYLTGDVVGIIQAAGFTFKGEIIWYDVAKKLHLYGINYEWIPSMVHQSILVFYKRMLGSAVDQTTGEVRAGNAARLMVRANKQPKRSEKWMRLI